MFLISDITILCNLASSFNGMKLDEPYLVHLPIRNKTGYRRPQNQGKCTLLSKNKIDAALLSHQKKN